MRKLFLIAFLLLSVPAWADSQTRVPTGDSAVDGWIGNVAAPNDYLDADDPVGVPDDATTYIYRQDSNATQRFTFAAFDITSSSVTKLTIHARCLCTVAGPAGVQSNIKVNGSQYTQTKQALTNDWAPYSFDYSTNPDTLASWLEADIEGTGANPLQEFGVGNTDTIATEEVQCTQVYAEVTYVAAATGGGSRLLLGVGK